MNVSEYIFDFFAKKGVDTTFMVTGGQAMWLNDAVGKDKRYQIICDHHEQACAMSADAYGRMKNRPAIALVTAGPGSVNAMNGVVGGWTDSSPMIVISGQAALSFVQYQEKTGIRQYGIQGINIRPLVDHVTKYFITIDSVRKLKYYLEKAYHLCTTGRPGPVWIDVPLDVQRMSVDHVEMEEYTPEEPAARSVVLQQAEEDIFAKLTEAKRPVLLVGQGVSLAGAREEFFAFATQYRIPVITARLGIDLIASDNDLYVGRPGNYGERSANIALQNADVILSIGCRLSSAMVGYDPEHFGRHAYKIVVDIDRKELNKPGVHIDYKVEGDAKAMLAALLTAGAHHTLPSYEPWVQQCDTWKTKYPVVQPAYQDEHPVNSYYFTGRLSALAPAHAAILVDTGSCFHVACQAWKVKKGQTFLTTGGLSSMGYWCACIGACMANDRKDTIVITGDGSLQMNIQEFATIRQNQLPIKVFIFDNDGYLLIRHTQRNFMNDRFVGESPASGVWCPDAMKIAAAYGIPGVEITAPEDVDEKIQAVLAMEGPVICRVKTPKWQLLVPRISSEKMPDGTLVSHAYEDMFPFLPREEMTANMIADAEENKN